MKFFNFVENFFLISLGITFILILLLVYHFKQRIVSIEQKNDSMFEIINNMVAELNRIRTIATSFTMPSIVSSISQKSQTIQQDNTDVKIISTPVSNNIIDDDLKKTKEDSDNGDDDDDDDDGDDGDYYDDDTDIDDADIDAPEYDDEVNDIKTNLDDIKVINIDTTTSIFTEIHIDNIDNEDIIEDVVFNQIDELPTTINNFITLDTDVIIDTLQIDDEEDDKQEDEIKKLQSQRQEVEIKVEEPVELPVKLKVEEPVEQSHEDDNDNEHDHEHEHEHEHDHDHDSVQSSQNNTFMYRKMNIQSLRTIVVTKGLCSDPTKMKKSELLRLLEENE